MSRMRAILVEDEPSGMENLLWKMKEYCPEIEVIAECKTARKAIDSIRKLQPDVVFLDIRLDTMSGFDVLNSIPFSAFDVIIVTDHKEYALDAIKQETIDFLVKPIKEEELMAAVRKLVERKARKIPRPSRVVLPVSTGERYVEAEDILYIESSNTRCHAFLKRKNKSLQALEMVELPRLLGEMEMALRPHGFARPNQSFLVNLAHIIEYIRSDGGWIVMRDDKPISITGRYRESFHRFRNDWFLGGK